MAAGDVLKMAAPLTVRIVPSAGDYYILDTKAAGYIRHIIFHEPEEKGKGLTLVPTVDGNILVGPTEREGGGYETKEAGLEELRGLIGEVIPSLPMEHVIRSFGAVRPNPYMNESGESISDFCIVESGNGANISFVGVKTPGLTCANELGIYAAGKLAIYLDAEENPDYDPHRAPPRSLSAMTFDEAEMFIRNNDPAYGRIVCRCRGVSEGEITDAIRRIPGAVTVDGVKRRTGAGSGRCQGGFCTQRVIEILARELRHPPEEILKDGNGSYFFQKGRPDNDRGI